jgi:parvulin-like peptidyl-prolyl isomerase
MDLKELVNFTPEEAGERLLLLPEMLEEAIELKIIAWKVLTKQDLVVGVKKGMLMSEFASKPASHGLDPTRKKPTVLEVEAALDRNVSLQKLREKKIDLQVSFDKAQQAISVIYMAKEILMQVDKNVNYSMGSTITTENTIGSRRSH